MLIERYCYSEDAYSEYRLYLFRDILAVPSYYIASTRQPSTVQGPFSDLHRLMYSHFLCALLVIMERWRIRLGGERTSRHNLPGIARSPWSWSFIADLVGADIRLPHITANVDRELWFESPVGNMERWRDAIDVTSCMDRRPERLSLDVPNKSLSVATSTSLLHWATQAAGYSLARWDRCISAPPISERWWRKVG